MKYLNHLKAQNQNKPEVEGNLKENLKNKDRTHQKPKRQKKSTHMKTLIITITMSQIRVEAADLIMVKVETDNLEGLHHEIEVKDPSIVSVNFKIITITEAHHNKIIVNMAMLISPIFRGIRAILIEAEAVDLNISEDAVVVGPTIRITGMYQYQYYTHDQQSEQYGPPCSLCSEFNHSPKHCYKGEHDINNIMEKMSINPHQSQQSNLYQ